MLNVPPTTAVGFHYSAFVTTFRGYTPKSWVSHPYLQASVLICLLLMAHFIPSNFYFVYLGMFKLYLPYHHLHQNKLLLLHIANFDSENVTWLQQHAAIFFLNWRDGFEIQYIFPTFFQSRNMDNCGDMANCRPSLCMAAHPLLWSRCVSLKRAVMRRFGGPTAPRPCHPSLTASTCWINWESSAKPASYATARWPSGSRASGRTATCWRPSAPTSACTGRRGWALPRLWTQSWWMRRRLRSSWTTSTPDSLTLTGRLKREAVITGSCVAFIWYYGKLRGPMTNI